MDESLRIRIIRAEYASNIFSKPIIIGSFNGLYYVPSKKYLYASVIRRHLIRSAKTVQEFKKANNFCNFCYSFFFNELENYKSSHYVN